jgi:hypothetical protein
MKWHKGEKGRYIRYNVDSQAFNPLHFGYMKSYNPLHYRYRLFGRPPKA